jgi:hypothetical protein
MEQKWYLSSSFSKLYRYAIINTAEWRQKGMGKSIATPLRWIWDGLYRNILYLKSGTFKASDTILVTGSQRSGTTWLGELLSAPKDYCMLFEPTVLWKEKKVVKGADWADHIKENSVWPEGKKLFENLFEGRGIHPHAFIYNSPASLMRSKSLIIKSSEANRLLPWLSMNFKIKGMVLIIRHPCAFIASMKKYMKKLPPRVPVRRQRFVDENLPHLASYVKELKTIDEILAARWCTDYYVPLKSSKRNSWIEVLYEKLVLSGPEELNRIYNKLNLSGLDAAVDRLTRRSLTTRSWSADHDYSSAKERLSNWKRSIDQQQLKRIFSVLEAFGISGYSDEVVPDSENIRID